MNWLDDMEAADPADPNPEPGTGPVTGCDDLGEIRASDDPLRDPANRELFEADMDRRLAERDVADRSLMDAAAALRIAVGAHPDREAEAG